MSSIIRFQPGGEEKENFQPKEIKEIDLLDIELEVYKEYNNINKLMSQNKVPIICENIYKDKFGEEVLGLCYLDNIYIKRSQLKNIQSFASTYIHELIHYSSGFSDCTREFEYELTSTIGYLYNLIYRNNPVKEEIVNKKQNKFNLIKKIFKLKS